MRKLRLKITLKHSDPEIYRMIEVPDDISFKTLHLAIQNVFGWDDCHAYEFLFEKLGIKVRKSTDYDYAIDYKIVKRRTAIKELIEEGIECYYIYDLSCYWAHKIECIAEFNSFDHSIHITSYQGDNIPEDCKSVKTFYHQKRHPEKYEVDYISFDVVNAQKLLDRFT